MATYKNLKIDEFEAQLKAHPEAIILDVRTPAEYASGHLENARNIPNIQSEYQNLDPARTYFVHCRVGGRSAVASQVLTMRGFEHVFNLNDAIEHTSLPLIKETVKA